MLVQIIFLLVIIFLILVSFQRYRRKELSLLRWLFWSILWLGAGILVILIRKTDAISQFFGVSRAADFAVYIAILILFYMSFRVFIKIEMLNRQITHLVRKISLLESRGKQKEEAQEASSEKI